MKNDSSARRGTALLTIGLAAVGLIALVLATERSALMHGVRGQLWGLNALHYAEFEERLPARRNRQIHIGVGPGELLPELAAPTLNPVGGIYTSPVALSASTQDTNAEIRCTLDGRIPTQRDHLARESMAVVQTTVVRCRSFSSGFQASPTTTHTYLIDPPGTLPILTLTLDPTHFDNKYTGIYAQYNERGPKWEREAHVEYLPRGYEKALRVDGRVRIHGFHSRAQRKKSFRFHFKTPPDAANDPENPLTWPSHGDEHVVIFGARELQVSRDELFQEVFAEAGGFAGVNRPVLLHVNAQPWGIYWIRERIDEEYLHRRVGPGEYDLLYLQPGKPEVRAGDPKHWEHTQQFFSANDLTSPDAYTRAAELIDIDNFTTYWLYNIYAANRDWPHHNLYVFRRRDGVDGRWRWISWDADAAFDFMNRGLQHDTLTWSTRAELRHDLRQGFEAGMRDTQEMQASTLIPRKLLANPDFRNRFASRMTELLKSDLSPDRVKNHLDRLHALLEPNLPLDWERWSIVESREQLAMKYTTDLAVVQNFIRERPKVLEQLFAPLVNNADPAGARGTTLRTSCAGCDQAH
jgi:hypothetical protein